MFLMISFSRESYLEWLQICKRLPITAHQQHQLEFGYKPFIINPYGNYVCMILPNAFVDVNEVVHDASSG